MVKRHLVNRGPTSQREIPNCLSRRLANCKAVKSITVVSVSATHKVAEHAEAIRRTMRALPFPASGLLLSKERPAGLDSGIAWAPYSKNVTDEGVKSEYGGFIINGLHKYINTDFCLLVQWDGYAINPHNWDDKFLDYDYIGAPFAENFLYELLFPRFRNRVGNGGFSLRSKKWLDLGATAPEYFGEAEDMFCTQQHVNHWRSQGCKIAPIEVAGRFSMEYPLSRNPELTIDKAFGFHGFLPDGRPRFYGKFNHLEMYRGSASRVLKRLALKLKK